ncbi:MAG: hypothetical protein OXE46_02740 [Chloroflexi bacterium]|nr:hypothetical protein [Chloroflexota bacterium]
MTREAELDRLLQRKWREEVIPELGRRPNDPWIPVYKKRDDGTVRLRIDSVLIPNENIEQLLQTPEWSRQLSELEPGFTGDSPPVYRRTVVSEDGREPLVIQRSFHKLKPDAVEILEEFRLYHNLYDDRLNSKLIRFDAGGNEVDVVKYANDLVQVRRKELRQFLAARDMSIVVFFVRQYHAGHLVELSEQQRKSCIKRDEFVYRFEAFDHSRQEDEKPETYSRLRGKKVIDGLPLEKCGIWPYATEEQERMNQLAEYCIGVDENGDDILASSARYGRYAVSMELDIPPDSVNYNFCTPVFFKREVLGKYYNEPSKYRVEDSYLRCGSLWGIDFDSDQPDFVAVLLDELGEKLPATEHAHWKAHNVPPDGNLSDPFIRMSFPSTLEEALNPGTDNSAFRFKHTLSSLSNAWSNVFGWFLFIPLTEADSHHFRKLRRPLTNEPTELQEIVLSLSILLQDQINKKELGNHIPGFQKKDADNKAKQNIPVLAEFLKSEDFADAAQYVEYLRMLQVLRSNSGTVHPRNEKKYQKAVKFFSLDIKSNVQVADEIFTTLTDFLDSLRAHFCPGKAD